MKVLVTGGAGYIGSHTLIELVSAGHTPVVVDNLSNGSAEALKRVEQILGQSIEFHDIDVRDRSQLEMVFSKHSFDAVIHFAGFKFVGESVAKPIEYYSNNLTSTLTLLDTMLSYGVNKIIFSSSSTVYGNNPDVPLKEESQSGVGLLNPYAWSKAMNEQILKDIGFANPSMSVVILRYFNPIGAHESGLIGEDPKGIPNNLLPYITQVAQGIREQLIVHGDDYDTPDGTCIRDYIHVVDLAKGHVAAIEKTGEGCSIYNLGTGSGSSVFDVIKAFESATGVSIPYTVGPRRAGDITVSYGNVEKANSELGWNTERTVEDGCRDSWRWQSENPEGYS